ncbi:MAG: HAD hydrolase-like protein [Pseudomonadota bacterium]
MDASTRSNLRTSCHDRLDPQAVAHAGLVLCDLDGCLISEGSAFADAADFVAACGVRLWVVSNRSDSTAEGLARQLAGLDLPVPAERILLAGEIALERLVWAGVRRLRLCAPAPLAARARGLGMETVTSAPEVVLLCRDASVTVETLGELLSLVADGAQLWVANEDLSHPGQDGRPVAETGALLAALRAIEPGLRWTSPGKPNPLMLSMALERAGLPEAEAVFVGDNAATDGAAARAAGLSFLHLQRSAAP